MKWLVTAFAPFGNSSENSALEVAQRLSQRNWNDQVRFHMPVPVAFSQAWPSVMKVIAENPDIDGVLALGQAGGRTKINLERLALNWIETSSPDNLGVVPATEKILGDSDLLWSPIPWGEFKSNNPDLFTTSFSAGTYVCNHLMFHLLDWAEAQNKLAGFVHIPYFKGQKVIDDPLELEPRLDLNLATTGLVEALEFLVQRE